MNKFEKALMLINERQNKDIYFSKYLKIKDRESSKVIPFVINSSQAKLKDIIDEWDKGTKKQTLFIVILKARRQGFSTYVEGDFFVRIKHEKGKTAMVISYDEESAKTVNKMTNTFYEHLPHESKPMRRPSRGRGLILENPKFDFSLPIDENTNNPGLQSEFLIETAGNPNAGSGYNINYLHISELSKFSGDIEVTMTSLLQAVPNEDSIVIIESTAKGYNYFKDVWDDANAYDYVDGNRVKRNDFIPLFIPWFEDKKSTMKYDFFKLTNFDHETWGNELELKELFNLTYEQLTWRRWCIKNKCHLSLDNFHQEYPCVAKGQKVSTSIGIKNIEDIVIGDKTETGIVEKVWNKGIKPILKITTFSKRIIRVTHDHLMATPDGFVMAKDLNEGSLLSLSKPIFSNKYYSVNYNEYPAKLSTIKIDEQIGLFLGYFMGDGCFLRNRKLSSTVDFACDKRDVNVCEEIESLCEYIIGSSTINRLTGKNKGCYNIRSNNNKWFDFMIALDCLKRKNDDRYTRKVHVPECIKNSPKSVIREFVSGLFEADGCIYKNSNYIMLFSKHEEFLRDVQYLLLGFGIGSNIRTQNKTNSEGKTYIGRVLYISAEYAYIFKNEVGFKSDRKISYCSKTPRKTSRKSHSAEVDKIISIVEDGEDQVYDLKLSNDNPTFGVNGILVHNCTPEEAFIATGSPIFDNRKIEARIEKLRNFFKITKYRTGRFEYELNVDKSVNDETIKFVDDVNGIIRIYEEPTAGHPYAIGGDTSGEGSDFFAAHVINNSNGRQVAVYHCVVNSDLFAYQMYCLGRYYNDALIAIEMNFDPHPIKVLQELMYPMIYRRESVDRIQEDIQEKYGFRTDRFTRPIIINNLISIVRDSIEFLYDIETLQEMLTFAKDKSGKPSALPGKHDDYVMSLAITYYCRRQMYSDVPVEEQYKDPKDNWKHEYSEKKSEGFNWL